MLSKVEDFCGALAAAGLGAIMLIVASDVGLRYVVGRPWSWAYDVVSIYLTISIFYLALSRTFREHGHISVDLAQRYMSPRVRHSLDLFICILSAGLFAVIAWITSAAGLDAIFRRGRDFFDSGLADLGIHDLRAGWHGTHCHAARADSHQSYIRACLGIRT